MQILSLLTAIGVASFCVAHDFNVEPGFQAWSGDECDGEDGVRQHVRAAITRHRKSRDWGKCFKTPGRHSFKLYEIDAEVMAWSNDDCSGQSVRVLAKNETCYNVNAGFDWQSASVYSSCWFENKHRDVLYCPDGGKSTHVT